MLFVVPLRTSSLMNLESISRGKSILQVVDILGFKTKYRNWFDDNDVGIIKLQEEKNRLNEKLVADDPMQITTDKARVESSL